MKNWLESAGTPGMALTGNVLKFPSAGSRPNRLTLLDRQQADLWINGPHAAWCSLSIFADPDESDDIGDFISIYRVNEDWASWGVARRGDSIILWETRQGKDLGVFASTLEALDAIWLLMCEPLSPSRASMKLHKRNR